MFKKVKPSHNPPKLVKDQKVVVLAYAPGCTCGQIQYSIITKNQKILDDKLNQILDELAEFREEF